MPEFHCVAIDLYADGPLAKFICYEFLEYDFWPKRFDWVLSLGALSVKQPKQDEYDKAFIKKTAKLAKNEFSVYLNDVHQMRSGRHKEVSGLAVHNIHEFVGFLKRKFRAAKVELVHYPTQTSQNTGVHVII